MGNRLGNRLGNVEAMPSKCPCDPDYDPKLWTDCVVDYNKWKQECFYPFFNYQMEKHNEEKNVQLLAEYGDVFMQDISEIKQ